MSRTGVYSKGWGEGFNKGAKQNKETKKTVFQTKYEYEIGSKSKKENKSNHAFPGSAFPRPRSDRFLFL